VWVGSRRAEAGFCAGFSTPDFFVPVFRKRKKVCVYARMCVRVRVPVNMCACAMTHH
jgi:hypothetical protein